MAGLYESYQKSRNETPWPAGTTDLEDNPPLSHRHRPPQNEMFMAFLQFMMMLMGNSR